MDVVEHASAPQAEPIRQGFEVFGRSAIRVVTPPIVAAGLLVLAPGMAFAGDGSPEVLAAAADTGLTLWGFGLAAVLWALAGAVAVLAGLVGGSRFVSSDRTAVRSTLRSVSSTPSPTSTTTAVLPNNSPINAPNPNGATK